MSDEYVKRQEIIETRWKCPSCGADNRGRDMKCASCSAPKDEASSYVVDETAAAVTDENQIADAKAGEHWVCAFCEKENRGRSKICAFCNADQTTRARKQKDPGPKKPAPQQKDTPKGCLIAVAFVVAAIGLIVWLAWPERVDGTVASMSWKQTTSLRKKTLVHEEAWKDALPSTAFETTCQDKYRRDQQVVDHYRTVTKTRSVRYQSGSHEECHTRTRDNGNGYATREEVCKNVPEYDTRQESYTDQEPVYRTEKVYEPYCSYSIHRWPSQKDAVRTGSDPAKLEWAPFSEVGDASCVECAGDPWPDTCCTKTGEYAITFSVPDKPEEHPVLSIDSAEEFQRFSMGQVVRIEVDGDKATLVKDE